MGLCVSHNWPQNSENAKTFGHRNGVFGELWSILGVFGEGWRRRDRLMDMYGLYWFECGCMYRYTVSIGKYEVFKMWSFWRFRGNSGGLETLAEA